MSSPSDPPPRVSLAVNGASYGADGGGGAGAAQVKPEPDTPSKRSNSMFVAFTIGVAVRKMQANFRGRRAQKAMQLLQKSKSFKHLHKSMGLGSGGPTRRTSQQYKSLWKRGITQVIDANKEDLEDEALSEEKIKAATLAAYYVEDAFAGRLSNGKAVMSGRDAFTFRCFNIHVHKNWTFAIIGANLLHTALIALERPRTFYGSALPYPRLALLSAALEWGCLGVYVADVALKSFYQGAATFFSYDSGKKWQLIYGVFVVWMMVDALVMAGSDADGGFRFSRPIRPVVMLLRSRAIRRFYTVVVDMIPAFMRVCMPIVFFLLAFATFAARLVANTGVAKHDSLFTSSLASYHTFFVLLMTCDNYSSVQDAFVSSHSFFGRAAFFMFLVVGVLFLVSLVLGVTFDAYTEHTKKQVKDEHMKELYGLTKAFATIDVDKTGEVNVPQFIQLMLTLRSDLSKFECHFLFDVLAGFDGVIDFIDFYGMRKVLGYHFLESEAKRRDKNKQALLQSPSAVGRALRYVNKSMAGRWFSNTQELLCVVDCAALLLDVEQYVLVSFGSSGYALTLGDAVGIMLLVELMLKVLLGGGIRLYWSGRGPMQFHPRTRAARRVDATLVLMSTLHLWFPWTHAIFGVKFSWAVWRVWRSTIFVHTLGVFFRCFLQILPVLMQTIGFAFVVMYTFAVIGMEFMGDEISHFETIFDSLYLMIQLLFAVDFEEVITECAAKKSPAAVQAYFVTYFLIAVMIVVNLITALMIEFYHHTMAAHDEMDEADAEITANEERDLMAKIKAANVLGMFGGQRQKVLINKESEQKGQMSLMDLRKKFGLGDQGEMGVTKADLKKCQKYATLDLCEMYDIREKREHAAKKAKLS